MKKEFISIVLVEPENPDNIGAVARAVKNMGFKDLRLVKPPRQWKIKGRKMAMSAADILEKARVFSSLEDSVRDVSLVVGTTRRQRKKNETLLAFDQVILGIKRRAHRQRVAILFGKESKGLDNVSLGLCDWITTIPTDSSYPSINLAQAVMIVVFSLWSQETKTAKLQAMSQAWYNLLFVSQNEVYDALKHLKAALVALDYEYEGNHTLERILSTFHGLVKRSGLARSEVQMLKGLSRRIRERALRKESGELG